MTSDDFRITRRNLPHWQLSGSVYFVTFRVHQGELNTEERNIIFNAVKHFHSRRYWIWASVIMPDHVHLLLQLTSDANEKNITLGKALQGIKGYTGYEINKSRNTRGKFWQEESFDRIVRDEEELREKWNYIRNNPVKKNLADTPENYAFLWEPGPP